MAKKEKKSELELLAEQDWAITVRCDEIFKRDWQQRFLDAGTPEEFHKIRAELRRECGIMNELPGTLETSVLLIYSKFYMDKEDK